MEESLEPLEVSQNRLAVAAGGTPRCGIVQGKHGCTTDTAPYAAGQFGTADRFWLQIGIKIT